MKLDEGEMMQGSVMRFESSLIKCSINQTVPFCAVRETGKTKGASPRTKKSGKGKQTKRKI
jgi:hypothetical protein